MENTLLWVACALSVMLSGTAGFRNGAPIMVCDSMAPAPHVHGPPQDNVENPPPYNVSCFQNEEDHKIIVEIGGAAEEDRFKGVLVEIRAGTNRRTKLGKFDTPADNNFKLACRGSAVTHSRSADKEFARFAAVLSDNELREDPHCVVTIVQVQRTHWNKLEFPAKLQPGFKKEDQEEESHNPSITTHVEDGNGGQNGMALAGVSSNFDSSFLNGGSFSLSGFSEFLDLDFGK